mgnify:CR=1 FL=1
MKTIKEPNPLNFFNVRKVNILPPHFEVVVQPMMYNLEDSVGRWIKTHLKGRYYIGRSLSLGEKGISNVTTTLRVGFEEPKELSYFTLACPLLKYK